METFGERIRTIRKERGLTQGQLAELISVAPSLICLMEKGRAKATARTVNDFCKEFGVNQEWLMTGKGEKYKEAPLHRELETALKDQPYLLGMMKMSSEHMTQEDWKDVNEFMEGIGG